MIVDASIMVSAVLGRSMPLLVRRRRDGLDLRAPVHQLTETRTILEHKAQLPPDIVASAMAALATVIEPLEIEVVMPMEQQARRRLGKRGQPDWPVLAAALALDEPIWSNDRDFFGVGVPVWSSRNIEDAVA